MIRACALQLRLPGVEDVTTLTTFMGCGLLAVGIWLSLTTLWREQA